MMTPRPLILIVDDYADAREVYSELLQLEGFETAEACDGQQAIEKARALRPSVILMDIAMPVMDGVEATRVLKADPETASIPVIAVTGQGDTSLTAAAREICDDFCPKPASPLAIVKLIESLTHR